MKLYACIISSDIKRDRNTLLMVAQQFSYSVELLEDGILFDVSGLQNLVGDTDKISQNILAELEKNSIRGSVAVADTIDTVMLLARADDPQSETRNPKSESFSQLPLTNLLDNDTLNVFNDLGIKSIRDLSQIPKDELVTRYGQQFKNIIDIIEQKGSRLLTPNVKENKVDWDYQLDYPVDDFEQLIFILNHGLDRLLTQTSSYGFSTEQLDIFFNLQNKTERLYEIKTSFPTLEKTFWLKLINLRISLDPPESEIVAIKVTSHFTPPRPSQQGLYAVSRPDPERLLLTVNKLKKLVGEENVGVPVLLDERVERAFGLDAEAVPEGKEVTDSHTPSRGSAASQSGEACLAGDGRGGASKEHLGTTTARQASPQCGAASREEENFIPRHPVSREEENSLQRHPVSREEENSLQHNPASREQTPMYEIPNPNSEIPNQVIAFSYFNPPIPADVLVRDKKLIFLRTQYFNGHVKKYSGVWKANSKWWDKSWKAQEWDVEIEDHGVYRLCKVGKDWFLAGEYD